MGRIWKLCLEPYRAGGLQDLIVDKREFALIELDLAVLAVGKNRELSVTLQFLLLNFWEVGLRQCKYHRNRLDLRDDHEPVDVGRMNDVTHVDLADAGNAVGNVIHPTDVNGLVV